MSTSLTEGFKGNANAEISYNTKTGFSASAGLTLTSTSPEFANGKFTTSDNGSISGNVRFDRTGFQGSTTVNTGQNLGIATNLSSLESELDSMAEANREFNSRMAENAYYDKLREKYSETANMSNEEVAEWKKTRAKEQGIYTDEADGTSRESFGAEILGSLSDLGNLVAGNYRGGNQTGYIDAQGNYHQRTCFTKGTKIVVEENTPGAIELNGVHYKKIVDVQLQDRVLSWDEKTGTMSFKPVTNLFERKTDLIYTIEFSGGTSVETTWNHPFRILGTDGGEKSEWIQAKDLKAGDVLQTANSKPVSIVAISTNAREETVYNFEVEGNHTYFVGEDGVLVHNEAQFYGNQVGKNSIAKDVGNLAKKALDKVKSWFGSEENSEEEMKEDLKIAQKNGAYRGKENIRDKNISVELDYDSMGNIERTGKGKGYHDYATRESAEIMKRYSANLSGGEKGYVNDASLAGGADTKWHAGHADGNTFDMGLVGNKGQKVADFKDKNYSPERTQRQIETFIDSAKQSSNVKNIRIYYNDQSVKDNIRTKYGKFVDMRSDNKNIHDNHWDVKINYQKGKK